MPKGIKGSSTKVECICQNKECKRKFFTYPSQVKSYCNRICASNGIREDLVGNKYGRLTVGSFSHSNIKGESYWLCFCDCDPTQITKPIAGHNLKRYFVTSCGCKTKEVAREKAKNNIIDLSGRIFGYLTCKRLMNTRRGKAKHLVWECECLCGNLHYVNPRLLVTGKVTSCGCRIKSNLHEKTKQACIDLSLEIFEEEMPIPTSIFTFSNSKGILKVDIVVILPNGLLVAIECNGEQHYRPISVFGGQEGFYKTIKRDVCKRVCLKTLNIPLVEIKYDCVDIREFLRREFSL